MSVRSRIPAASPAPIAMSKPWKKGEALSSRSACRQTKAALGTASSAPSAASDPLIHGRREVSSTITLNAARLDITITNRRNAE
jgi:hypothetical protein